MSEAMMAGERVPLLELRGITQHFSGVIALDAVSPALYAVKG